MKWRVSEVRFTQTDLLGTHVPLSPTIKVGTLVAQASSS